MSIAAFRMILPFLALICATVPAYSQNGSGFPMLGFASGQSVRLNALNAAGQDPASTTSCTVTFSLLDNKGNVLKQTVINLQPGNGGSLDLDWAEVAGADLRVQVRAVLQFGYAGGANPPPQVLNQAACGYLVPSVEVFDNLSGRTSIILTDAKALPPPVTPAA